MVVSGPDQTAPDVGMGHYVVVRRGLAPGLRREIGPEGLTIGRSDGNDLCLAEGSVSSRHCRIDVAGGELRVEDLGSTNGTYVDGRRLDGAQIVKPGFTLQAGTQVLYHEHRRRQEVAESERLNAELARARAYVEALLPARLTDGTIVSDWCFVPCEVLGGDAFGYHRLDDGRLAVYLIDVCGHGAAAALHSVSVINVIRRQALRGVDFGDPGDVLTGLNDAFPMDLHDGMFFSAWYGVYDENTRGMRFCAAGHPPAIVVSAQPPEHIPLVTRGLGIGCLPGKRYRSETITMPPASSLYLYSDGIFEIETAAGERWAHGDFLALLTDRQGPATHEVTRVRDGVWQVAGTQTLPDDLSLVVMDFA